MRRIKLPKYQVSALGILLTAVWAAVMLVSSSPQPLRAVCSIAFLLTVPGFYALRLVVGKLKKATRLQTFIYSVLLSILTLMLTGLALNQAFITTHRSSPLSLRPLVMSIAGVTVAFALLSLLRKLPPIRLRIRRPKIKALVKGTLFYGAALSLPLLAIGGAYTLNNGGSNWLAMVVFALIALTMLAVALRKRLTGLSIAFLLYCICLALLLGTSMRGWNITGHDIMQEYQVFLLTLKHQEWRMSYYQDAYNACLSITILPTILQKLTGIAPQYVYKFVFQLYFALIAPLLFSTFTKLVSRRTAFLATAVFLTFPTFLTDITMLNRQETAFLFFAASINVGLNKLLTAWQRIALVFLLISGVVLSHYSTSYVAIAVMVMAVLLGIGVRSVLKMLQWARYRPTSLFKIAPSRDRTIYPIPVIIGAFIVLVGWNVLATHTAGNIEQTFSGLSQEAASVAGVTPPPVTTHSGSAIDQYNTYVLTTFKTLPASAYYPQATVNQHPLQAGSASLIPENSLLTLLHATPHLLYEAYTLSRALYSAVIVGLIVAGTGIIWLKRRTHKIPSQYILLCIAFIIIIGLQTVLPSALIDYGLTRLVQQGLIVLSLGVVVGAYFILRLLKLRALLCYRIIGVVIVACFLLLSGFLPAITGGFTAALPLSNSGLYYDAYYTHQDEVSADTWLATKVPVGAQVNTNEFLRRQLIAYGGIFSQPTLDPIALPTDSYVYLSSSDARNGEVPAYLPSGDLIYYKVPYGFLNSTKNLVYNSGSIKIYH